MTQDLLSEIRARHASASAKADRLRAQLDATEKDCRDYETAIKVLEEIRGQTVGAQRSEARTANEAEGPTMPELILLSLEEGPKAIAAVITTVADLSDKETDANNIRSTAWRMWKAGRIGRTGDEYHLLGAAVAQDDTTPVQEDTGEKVSDLLG